MFQTEEYARELFRAIYPRDDDIEREKRVQLRLKRQDILTEREDQLARCSRPASAKVSPCASTSSPQIPTSAFGATGARGHRGKFATRKSRNTATRDGRCRSDGTTRCSGLPSAW